MGIKNEKQTNNMEAGVPAVKDNNSTSQLRESESEINYLRQRVNYYKGTAEGLLSLNHSMRLRDMANKKAKKADKRRIKDLEHYVKNVKLVIAAELQNIKLSSSPEDFDADAAEARLIDKLQHMNLLNLYEAEADDDSDDEEIIVSTPAAASAPMDVSPPKLAYRSRAALFQSPANPVLVDPSEETAEAGFDKPAVVGSLGSSDGDVPSARHSSESSAAETSFSDADDERAEVETARKLTF